MKRYIQFLIAATFLAGLLFWLTPIGEAARCYVYSSDVGYVCHADIRPPTFVTPEPFPDSFLPHRRYARLADNINIYPEPSTSATPVRNVGDGFLFATISGQVEVNGELWYLINPGEYAHSSGVRLVDTPDFQGVRIQTQPERPFGWVVQDFTPSSEPDGEPDERFMRLTRFTFFEVYDAVTADDGWIWYDIGDGRWMRQTFASLVDVNRRPPAVGPDEFWTEVDLYEQTFAAYEGDRMVYATLISSGLNRWPTREGLFQVWDRWVERKMSGAEGRVDYYFIEDVPHTMYFDEMLGIALHGAYWHDRYGYKHSHGCVNMPPYDAEWTFNWSKAAPNDLWVWVHTSDPAHYFDKFSDEIPPESYIPDDNWVPLGPAGP